MTAHRTVTPSEIPENELREEFLCTASGPGGQHVNRTANTVRLYFQVRNSVLLTEAARERLIRLAGGESDGWIVVTCRETRSLNQNRNRVREILADWITRALTVPRKRKKTAPTRAAREKRLQEKAQRSQVKAARSGKYD